MKKTAPIETDIDVAAVTNGELSEGLNPSDDFKAKWIATHHARRLAASLVNMREEAGLSQKELAKTMGKDQAFVSRMESATQHPKGANIDLYARACGWRMAYASYKVDDASNGVKIREFIDIGQTDEDNAIHGLRDLTLT